MSGARTLLDRQSRAIAAANSFISAPRCCLRLFSYMARAGPFAGRTCPLRQLQDDASIATAQAACHAPASVAVTAVTDLLFEYPIIFWTNQRSVTQLLLCCSDGGNSSLDAGSRAAQKRPRVSGAES